MSSPNRSTKKRSVAEKGDVDNGTSAKKMREEEESKIPGIKQEETGEVPDMLKQETGEDTDALKQETDDEMDALKHETDDEMEEEDDVYSPPLPPLPGASEIAEGTLNADSNADFYQAGEDGDNDSSGGDDSGGNNADANTSKAADSYNRNEASSDGSVEARPHVGLANPNGNKHIAKWNGRYLELVVYKEKHGNCNASTEDENNTQLGYWVATQRQNYRLFNKGKKSQMTEERIAKLDEISFVWEANEAAWKAKLAELVAYKAEHGDCLVPTIDENNKQLGVWVNKQRAEYQQLKKGKKSWMTDERIAKLNEIGFEWDANEAAWEAKLAELVAYKEEHGDCNVPNKYEPNKQLGRWVNTQRHQYGLLNKGKKTQMTEERIDKLNNIGFEWDAYEAAWTARFAELVAYKAKHGDGNVPLRYGPNKALGEWVKVQRAQYQLWKEGKKSWLTEERIAKLSGIGFKLRLK